LLENTPLRSVMLPDARCVSPDHTRQAVGHLLAHFVMWVSTATVLDLVAMRILAILAKVVFIHRIRGRQYVIPALWVQRLWTSIMAIQVPVAYSAFLASTRIRLDVKTAAYVRNTKANTHRHMGPPHATRVALARSWILTGSQNVSNAAPDGMALISHCMLCVFFAILGPIVQDMA
jgi:hypothetical protein